MSQPGAIRLDLVTWTLLDSDINVFVDVRETLRKLRTFSLDVVGADRAHRIDEQLRVLDRLLGHRGLRCEIPRDRLTP